MCSAVDINTDVLISEIEKRPAIYNTKLKEYSDKVVKKKLWTEVAEMCIENWNQLEPSEKDEKGADLQKKWKNLRTCFKREYNLQTKEPSGSGSKKRRKYLYFDQLLFLKDSLEQRITASNLGETNNPTDGTEEEDEVSETASQSTPRPKNITCRKRKPDSRQKTYEESLLEILKQKRDEEQEIDEDRYFLLSLLPEFKKFSEDQKYYAKTEMMTLMRRIRLSGNSNSQMFAYHNHNVAAPATTHQTMAMNSTVPVPPPQQISTNEPRPLTYQALSPDQEWDVQSEVSSYVSLS